MPPCGEDSRYGAAFCVINFYKEKGIMYKQLCPKCGSDNLKIIDEDFGRCNACGAKFILLEKPAVVCTKCGSANVKIIEDDFARCLDCGAKMVLDEEPVAQTKIETKTEVSKPAVQVAAVAGAGGANIETANEIKTPISVNCDNCGSSDVDVISDEMAKCRHCGATILLHAKDVKPTVMQNEVHIHGAEVDIEDKVGCFAVKRSLTSEEFARRAYIYAVSSKTSPVDVVESEFMPATHEYANILEVNADVNVTYSATIGYDRKVQYKELSSNGKSYVTKTKIVTDWSPFSGVNSGNYTEFRALNEINDLTESNVNNVFSSTILTVNKNDIISYDDAEFEKGKLDSYGEGEIERSKDGCISTCAFEAKRRLPGDHNKDFSYNGTATVKKVKEYNVPVYTTKYKYKDGTEFSANAFGIGTPTFWGEQVDATSDIERVVDQDKKVSIFSKVNFVATILCMVASLLCWFIKQAALPAWCVFIATVAVFIVYIIFIKKARKKILGDMREEKIKRLNTLFVSKGLSPLTEEEIESLRGELS